MLLSLSSCEKFFQLFNNDDDDLSVGYSEEIQNFVPDSMLQQLTDLGMPLNEGKEPPWIEGSYFVSENLMKSSNVPDESYETGHRFYDYQYYFYDQDNERLTISMDTKGIDFDGNVQSESDGTGAFLSGYEDDFTAFIKVNGYSVVGENETAYYQTLEVVSGYITSQGIEDFHNALFMLDDYGDPYDCLIPVNTGRVMYDSDGLAPDGSSYKSAIFTEKGKALLGLDKVAE
jgi:hypothetical protein